MSNQAPCLILAYRRPVLEEIIKPLLEFGVVDIYIAFDGSSSHEVKNFQIRELEKISEFCRLNNVNLSLLRRTSKLGIAVAIPEALDWFFSKVTAGIIIEDDLRFEKGFIDFLSLSLKSYEFSESVENISGNQFFEQPNHIESRIVDYPLIWGWATWSDRWRAFRGSPYPEPPSTLPKKIIGFWNIGLSNSVSHRVDSWAMTYARYQRFKGKKTILPCMNLCSNVGADDVATHSNNSDWSLRVPISELSCDCGVLSSYEIEADSGSNSRLVEDHIYGIKARHRFTKIHVLFSKIRAKLKFNSGKIE